MISHATFGTLNRLTTPYLPDDACSCVPTSPVGWGTAEESPLWSAHLIDRFAVCRPRSMTHGEGESLRCGGSPSGLGIAGGVRFRASS